MGLLGIRFHPRDEELIRYLLKFVSCKNYSCHNIRFEDLYGNQKPWEIFESNSSGDDEDAKKPQLPPICIDESGYDYQLPQQIVTCPMAQQSTDFSSQSELYDLLENIF
ncbi:hypothetical protein BC332_26787 [Capsicum chinense]|nr:hypothetical protein BC332_26787 [Capsicum chinense]